MKMLTVISLCLLATLVRCQNPAFHTSQLTSKLVDEVIRSPFKVSDNLDDIDLDVPTLIAKHGYPVEMHKVTTNDGYILTLHRIPHGKRDAPNSHLRHDLYGKGPRQPLLLQHGLLSSSGSWILNKTDQAPAYIFADAGYDVWLGNARGNEYSIGHRWLNINSEKFWEFSWSEMGEYDIPAVINFILEKTRYEKLVYVGHSMGTTMFFAAMNDHPELNEKIHVMFGLGPVAYVDHLKSPIKYFSYIAPAITKFFHVIGVYQFFPNNIIFKTWAKTMCTWFNLEKLFCEVGIMFLTGFDTENFDTSLMPLIVGHLNSGTSLNTVNHFSQEYQEGNFQRYDYGSTKNRIVYGQTTPPKYDLKKVTAPLYLFYGENDWLADPADVINLAKHLKKGFVLNRVPDRYFNHLDFICGKNDKEMIYDEILEQIPRYINPQVKAEMKAPENMTKNFLVDDQQIRLLEDDIPDHTPVKLKDSFKSYQLDKMAKPLSEKVSLPKDFETKTHLYKKLYNFLRQDKRISHRKIVEYIQSKFI